jgi:hypothetical protein
MKARLAFILLGLLLLGFVANRAAADKDKKYTLADLKALVDSKAYDEALRHLGDITPQDRKADWIDIAGKASVGYVQAARASAKLEAMLAIERSYPLVLQAQRYLTLRAQLAPEAFARCFREDDFADCRDWARDFVDADPKNGTLQLEIARVVRRGMSHEAALPFFKRALSANKPAAVCPDDDLELAVLAGLRLPSKDARIAEASAVANACWADLGESVSKLTWEGGDTRNNACALLRSHQQKSPRCP